MCQFEGWTSWLEPAFLLWKPEDHDYERPPYMTQTEPKYTPEEELAKVAEEVDRSDGFDIDFSCLRCVFNYHPAMLTSHQWVTKPETTGDLLERLSQRSLEKHNEQHVTSFEFVKVVKANYHWSCAITYLITFEVKDPYDNLIKPFQARVRHGKNIVTEYIFCRPKPNQDGVEYFGTVMKDTKKDVEKDVKKQRLE